MSEALISFGASGSRFTASASASLVMISMLSKTLIMTLVARPAARPQCVPRYAVTNSERANSDQPPQSTCLTTLQSDIT